MSLTSPTAGKEWGAMPDEPDNLNPPGAPGETLTPAGQLWAAAKWREFPEDNSAVLEAPDGTILAWRDGSPTYGTPRSAPGRAADDGEG